MEYLPHAPLHYEHVKGCAYARILDVNKTELDTQKIEALWSPQVYSGSCWCMYAPVPTA